MSIAMVFSTPKIRSILLIISVVLGILLITLIDVSLRARSAYLKGEHYMAWVRDPQLKDKALNDDFNKKKTRLDFLRNKGKLTAEQHSEEIDVLEFDRRFRKEESDLKYAYQWYRDAYVLFTPPETIWSKNAKMKAKDALELWKQELREKKIPFDEKTLQ